VGARINREVRESQPSHTWRKAGTSLKQAAHGQGRKLFTEGDRGKRETRIRPQNYILNFPYKGKNYGTNSRLKTQNGTILIL
jgi:hypothetical protein